MPRAQARAAEGGQSVSGRQVRLLVPVAADGARAAGMVRAELAASGFVVTDAPVIPTSADGDPAPGELAVVRPDVASGRATAEVRLAPRSGGVPGERHRIDLGPLDGLAEGEATRLLTTLAVRVGELLRARASEVAERPRLAGAVAPVASLQTVRAAPPPPGPFALEAGIAVGRSITEVGPAVGPSLRLAWRARGGLTVAGELVGLTFGSTISAEAGSAQVRQTLALASLGWSAAPARRFQPWAAIGVGAQHTLIDGEGAPAYRGQIDTITSLACDASAGLAVALGPRWSVVAAAHAFRLAPRPRVLIHFDTAGTAGVVSLFGAVGLRVRL